MHLVSLWIPTTILDYIHHQLCNGQSKASSLGKGRTTGCFICVHLLRMVKSGIPNKMSQFYSTLFATSHVWNHQLGVVECLKALNFTFSTVGMNWWRVGDAQLGWSSTMQNLSAVPSESCLDLDLAAFLFWWSHPKTTVAGNTKHFSTLENKQQLHYTKNMSGWSSSQNHQF